MSKGPASVVRLAVLPALLLVAADGVAVGGARHQAIRDLGALNGVALQCRFVEEMRRMKQAVVSNAPKQRSYGLAFDESTNQSFLQFIEQGKTCPHPDNFHRQVGHLIDKVEQIFAAE